ncbi:LamG-like jellyroll fold domain-containing protein [Thalassobellus suaedae]|uniref:LamG-like jellyroll fold domain-containing protein n=1 Tax=Thalassobellus suaedae TaxID=3074124 RepID=A0ABY9XTW0_9FLAO|nr:LamG-like jellyroll fold domain-containing protein [Flavobacteriaceae bacterium HL-DH14]
MKRFSLTNLSKTLVFVCFSLISYFGNSQDIEVNILGGSTVTGGASISISSGNSISFRITNTRTDCDKVKIESISLTNTTDFEISTDKIPTNIDTESCNGKTKKIDFTITNNSGNCGASTDIIIEVKQDPNFTFTFSINGNSEINVLGGTPSADIFDGSTLTNSSNGTYFGVVDDGASVTRYFVISNTGSCPLDIINITNSPTDPLPRYDFTVPTYVLLSDGVTSSGFTTSIDPGSYVILPVTFTGPAGGLGTLTSTISITHTVNTTFTFDVSAEMFNYNIPGPGGVTADFRLWLKSTRGITTSGSNITDWIDIGTNGKDATTVSGKEPTYLDTAKDNINFNPVIKFENDGGATEQYMYNNDSPLSGFYSADIFIVMIPDASMTNTSSRNTIFASVDSETTGDITGVGFGDYSTEFTDETLSYNQDVAGGGSFNGVAELNTSYSNVGIINIRNNTISSPTGQEILYNSNLLSTSTVSNAFTNIEGNKYWIGKNYDGVSNLNGRVAEIFTFGTRVDASGRQKIESYLAVKYGITLGASTEAQKDYINSFETSVWDVTLNTGFNYHVAGIGRDDNSDLNQKQSKTINTTNEVTIGLNGVFDTNSANTNEFNEDGDFLVWGCNNSAYTGSNTNTITIASGITTSLTRIDRKWKIVESIESGSGGDVENVYVSIPIVAFNSFSKTTDEEYVLIVADDSNFSDGDIIDVIPLKSDGAGNLNIWYDFDGTKFFTFGKAPKLAEKHSVSFASGDYMVGGNALNLNINDFTISAWIKNNAVSANPRTIMSKGSKLQLRLNTSNQIEVMVDDDSTPRFTSSMMISDSKWHQITFVYISGTIFLYIDGVLDKSEQNISAPSPNFNRFSIGALYVDKNTVSNPFLGEIDEVYVWDQGLSENEVRYLMNQEIEKVTGDYVSGKTIPTTASSNEVAAISWSKLKAYYDFNSFYGTTVEGLANDRTFLRIKYLNKNKMIVDSQTTPLPYISASNGVWDDDTTWSNNVDQVIPNSLSLDGSTKIDWNIVTVSHDITSGDRDISLLGLIQTEGKLTLADPVVTSPVENNTGQALTISHYLELDGVIDLVGESQLIQTEGSIVDADSGGYITRDQQGTANAFNYNYWSSSVGPISGDTSTRGVGVSATNTNYTVSGVLNDGTDASAYQNLMFSTSPNVGISIPESGIAKTISTYWFYKFYGATNSYNSWVKIDELSSLLPGEGFTMKGVLQGASVTDNQNYVFEGLPNNGDITLALNKVSGTGDVDRLIGNPYPSAIDATEFILDNLSVADGGNNTNGTVFNGALYFWDHFGEENSHYLSNYVGGYATRNLTGGAVAISNDSRINDNLRKGTKVPGQYISVNQGFFVSTALDGFDNDNGTPILTVDGGDIIFKNSQRVFAREDGSTSLFFKSSKTKKTNSSPKKDVNETPTIKLMYDSPLGYHRQIVVGLKERASNAFDLGYDAFMADVNVEDMYWVFDNNQFVIQGVNNFEESQELAFGVVVKKSGLASIKIDALENIDANKPIYISDNVTGEVSEINSKPFEVYLETGTYNDRFKLVFQKNNESLEIEDADGINNVFVYFDSKASQLKIVNKQSVYLSHVKLYNILGQSIEGFDVDSSNNTFIPLSVKTGAYIVKLETENGMVSKKIIIE